MEAFFGCDFSSVRVHADGEAAASARALSAVAYTSGSHVVFGDGRFAPESVAGWRLLAHELAHVVQQREGLSASRLSLEREAQAAERGERPSWAGHAPSRPEVIQPSASIVQYQVDQAAAQARLQEVRRQLALLRARYQQLSEAFSSSVTSERERESLRRGTERLESDARSDAAARQLWGGSFAARRIRQAATVAVSGATATVTANVRIAYLALTDQAARKQADSDIPNIERAIRDVWQVNITDGIYAGMQFRLAPRITYLAKATPAPDDAFLIQVRGPDSGPSSGDAVHGVISLAPVHLEGSRVIVVAHELAHVFGFVDAYLQGTHPGPHGTQVPWASVGRIDPHNRPDLLGMIDPVVLARWQRSGAITAADVARQSGPVHVWSENAATVLEVLGAPAPAPARPSPDSDDFDPEAELDRVKTQGEARLSAIRARRDRIDNTTQSIDLAEQIMALEQEEKELIARAGATP
jgi:hypothetical protein